MKTIPRPASAGIALIFVMIAILGLSILAAGFAYSMKVETKLAMNADSETELVWLGRSGVEYARWVLAQQLALGCEPYDSLNQKWAGGPGGICTSNSALADISLQNYPLGNGHFSLKITDLERKFNINVADEAMLDRALGLVGADPSESTVVVGSILDWIDRDDLMHIGGAESDYYQALDPPYFAKNKPIDDLSELLLVRGVTPEIYWGGASANHQPAAFLKQRGPTGLNAGRPAYPAGLVDLFTPISTGRININTASATTLQLIPGVDENIASEIIRLRAGPDGVDGTDDDTPFHSAGELVNAGVNRAMVQQASRYCDVRSRTFEVQVDAEVNGYKRQFIAILGRNTPRDVQVLSFYWK
jgi:general secretion pathway protein K